MDNKIVIGIWAIAWRTTISIAITIVVIALAANQIAGIGYRYGMQAGVYACQQSSLSATNR